MAELLRIPLPVEVDERPGREALRGQIENLERQLAAYAWDVVADNHNMWGQRQPGARLQTLADLESQRDALAFRLGAIRKALDAQGAQHEANRGLMERVMLNPEAHPWVRVTNEDIGEPGCRQVHAVPRFGIFGRLAQWWRIRISSGCPLCMAR